MLDCQDGYLSLALDRNNERCDLCRSASHCSLYSFGAMMSRQRGIWRIYSNQSIKVGHSVQLKAEAATLLKLALGCYGLPVAMLVASALTAHLLFATEWLTVAAGLTGLAVSYLLLGLYFRCARLADIQLVQ